MITDRDWILVALGEQADPLGSGNRPATLRFDTATSRAMGFAGCNTYSAEFALSADSLSFQPPISTKMACSEGMELEITFLATLTAITTYQATDSSLTLLGLGAPLARFRPQ
jgi:putative lipoprotein